MDNKNLPITHGKCHLAGYAEHSWFCLTKFSANKKGGAVKCQTALTAGTLAVIIRADSTNQNDWIKYEKNKICID